MSDLYPSFDMPDIVGAVESQEVAFPKSWLWDWDICDFVQTGGGDVVEADGLTAWVQWCVKAILTQRLAYVVYDWDYGADIESCLKQPTRAVTEAELEREITEALLTDPRTAEVKNFRFEWSGDELTVWFTVVNALGQPAEVQVGVGYREVQRQFSLSRVEQYVSDWMRGELVNVEPTEDGKLVIKTVAQPTFTRSSIAYKSDGSQVAENVPRFEAGKFGQGILIEEETTNAIPHSSDGKFVYTDVWDRNDYTNDIVEWITDSSVPSPALHVKRTTPYPANDGCALVTFLGSSLDGSVVPGQKHTISLWFKGNKQLSSIIAQIRFIYYDSSYEPIGSEVVLPISFTDNWQRYVFTVTAPDGAYGKFIAVGLESINLNDTYEFYIAGLQFEQKEYATSWTVGTRQAEKVTVPISVVNPLEGSVSVWVNVNDASKRQTLSVYPTIFSADVGGNGKAIWLYHKSDSAKWRFQLANESGSAKVIEVEDSITPNGWHHFAITWSANKMVLYIDGVKRGEELSPPLPSSFIGVYVGCWGTGANQIDTVLDDCVIYNRQLSDNEVQAIYNSNQPAPITENTTYALRFDNSLKVGRGGYRLSKPIYLKSLGTCNGSNISWEANIPAGCDVKVYASVDGSTFQECENNAPIPSLSEGVSLVDKVLVIKEVLLTEDGVNRPELMVVRYNVDGTVTLRG